MNRVHCGDRVYENVSDYVDLDVRYGNVHITGTIDCQSGRPGFVSLFLEADTPLTPHAASCLPWARLMESAIARSVGTPRPGILDDPPSYRLDPGEGPPPR